MRYEIRLAGVLDDQMLAALPGSVVESTASTTVVVADFDQAGLHGLLERLRRSGLDLVEVRRIHGSPHADSSSRADDSARRAAGAGSPEKGDPDRRGEPGRC